VTHGIPRKSTKKDKVIKKETPIKPEPIIKSEKRRRAASAEQFIAKRFINIIIKRVTRALEDLTQKTTDDDESRDINNLFSDEKSVERM
jgi:hypothetical protein